MKFEEIYHVYFQDVYLYIRSLTHNESIAEEITQGDLQCQGILQHMLLLKKKNVYRGSLVQEELNKILARTFGN